MNKYIFMMAVAVTVSELQLETNVLNELNNGVQQSIRRGNHATVLKAQSQSYRSLNSQ